jgi:hypothetical protein
MKRVILIAASLAMFSMTPRSVSAQTDTAVSDNGPVHYNGGLGFHSIDAPLGGRFWFADQKVAVDFGLGLRSDPAPSYDDESLMGWTIELGVPIRVKSWDRVHVLARPGFIYDSVEVETSDPPDPFDTDNQTTIALTAELEVEVFLVSNFSVSASHGIGYFKVDPPGGGDSESSWNTFGADFSHIGFHYYFFGGGQ